MNALSTPEDREAARGIAEYLRTHPLLSEQQIITATGVSQRLFNDAYAAGWFRGTRVGHVSDTWMQVLLHWWLNDNAYRYQSTQSRDAAALAKARELEDSRESLGVPFPCNDPPQGSVNGTPRH